MKLKTVTVTFTMPAELDPAYILGEMADEFYYANKSNEYLVELLHDISYKIEGVSDAYVQS